MTWFRRNLVFITLFSVLLFSGCILPPQAVPFEPILQDTVRSRENDSLYIWPGLKVISSKAELEPLKEIFPRLRSGEVVEELNQTDFSVHLLLIVFQGDQANGGYAVEVQYIQRSRTQVEICAKFVSPEPNDLVPLSTTSPYQVVRIRRADLPSADEVTFVLIDVTSGEQVTSEKYTIQ